MYAVTLNLNARFQPFDRHDLEDVLESALSEEDLGEIDGGGTLMGEEGEVKSCDIEISMKDISHESMERLKSIVNSIGVAKGSKIVNHEQGEEIFVGTLEGLGLYLNGVDLPDEVYANNDINEVVDKLNSLLGEACHVWSHASLSQETALYFYGRSFEEMKGLIFEFVGSHPLCERCRIIQVA